MAKKLTFTIPTPPPYAVLGVRVDRELEAEIKAAAAADARSVSMWLALAARNMLRRGKGP